MDDSEGGQRRRRASLPEAPAKGRRTARRRADSRTSRAPARSIRQPTSSGGRNSHGNRTWHKLAENALATFGETPESEKFLHYAVTKFFAAYPVWVDEDGGWHEGLNYWAVYMAKATWWLSLAKTTLGIDGFKNRFSPHFAVVDETPMPLAA